MTEPATDAVAERIRSAIDAAVARLSDAGARTEALAEFVPERRVYGIRRRAKMRPLGRVWRLGVFLLSPDGELYATGSTTRAVPPGHPNYQSASGEERRAYRAAAFKGPFERGEVVNFAAATLDPAAPAGPLVVQGGEPMVRWSAAADALAPFETYFAERVELLAHPPQGA